MQHVARYSLPLDDATYKYLGPGRGLSPLCLDLPPYDPDPLSQNSTDHFECLNLTTPNWYSVSPDVNKSVTNKILNKPEGWFYGPAKPPAELDFEATTFGSVTSCDMVTDLCDIFQHTVTEQSEVVDQNSINTGTNSTEQIPVGDYGYDCKRDRAGLNIRGNFSDIRDPAGFGFDILDFTDSTMSTITEDMNLRGPTLWYAVLVQVRAEFVKDDTWTLFNVTSGHNGTSGMVFIERLSGFVGPGRSGGNWISGILSCNTTVSDVVRLVLDPGST